MLPASCLPGADSLHPPRVPRTLQVQSLTPYCCVCCVTGAARRVHGDSSPQACQQLAPCTRHSSGCGTPGAHQQCVCTLQAAAGSTGPHTWLLVMAGLGLVCKQQHDGQQMAGLAMCADVSLLPAARKRVQQVAARRAGGLLTGWWNEPPELYCWNGVQGQHRCGRADCQPLHKPLSCLHDAMRISLVCNCAGVCLCRRGCSCRTSTSTGIAAGHV